MKAVRILLLCIIYLTVTNSTIFSDFKENHLSQLKSDKKQVVDEQKKILRKHGGGDEDVLQTVTEVKSQNNGLNTAKKVSETKKGLDMKKQQHHKSIMNYLKQLPNRRKYSESTDTDSSSSSMELKNWKDEWKEHWLQKKLEAINSTVPQGDFVNMVAARPWGVPCGDPNQHDTPWGTCMLPMECEPEYRIYRGDIFCGRTMFICCALQLTNYDLYGGFDVSFADSSLATDSEEKKNRDRGSKERKRRKRVRDRKKRQRERLKRKRKIKRAIRKIIREIKKILNRSYRNGTKARKRKTKQLKKFIKNLKKKYKKDRVLVKDIHEMEMIKIDDALKKRIDDIRHMNRQFAYNSTFRNIVVNGTINKKSLKMLVKAYPELSEMIDTRRAGGRNKGRDYLDYDIEYGLLYY